MQATSSNLYIKKNGPKTIHKLNFIWVINYTARALDLIAFGFIRKLAGKIDTNFTVFVYRVWQKHGNIPFFHLQKLKHDKTTKCGKNVHVHMFSE